jgi:hypothetical protein
MGSKLLAPDDHSQVASNRKLPLQATTSSTKQVGLRCSILSQQLGPQYPYLYWLRIRCSPPPPNPQVGPSFPDQKSRAFGSQIAPPESSGFHSGQHHAGANGYNPYNAPGQHPSTSTFHSHPSQQVNEQASEAPSSSPAHPGHGQSAAGSSSSPAKSLLSSSRSPRPRLLLRRTRRGRDHL